MATAPTEPLVIRVADPSDAGAAADTVPLVIRDEAAPGAAPMGRSPSPIFTPGGKTWTSVDWPVPSAAARLVVPMKLPGLMSATVPLWAIMMVVAGVSWNVAGVSWLLIASSVVDAVTTTPGVN